MRQEQLDMEKGETKRIRSPGRCIYCGSSEGDLTDEHIIPFAIGGDSVIYESACCIPCQKLIQPYEQQILRSQLAVFRARIGAPTRRKRDRPTHSRLHFIEVNERGEMIRPLGFKDIPIDEAPLAFSVWNLAPPRILGEDTTEKQHAGEPWCYVNREVAVNLARAVAAETGSEHVAVKVDSVHREHFLRFLVKTAHAFAISEVGLGAFRALTTDLILCRDDDLTRYVGGYPREYPFESSPANMTELSLGQIAGGPAAGCTAVRIRLYPMFKTPAHIVIVGSPN